MKIVMPYGIRLSADGKIEVMPVVEARIKYGDKNKTILGIFLIDSGATTTLLPSTDAQALGLMIASGVKVAVGGVTGHYLVGYRHEISLEIQGCLINRVPVVFTRNRNVPRVLGREGIFSKFTVIFDEARKRTALLDALKEEKRIEALLS
ncbi:MAG: retroviral-like aspartic protease family protein [Candidatus Sungbacteria bacterium]|nr:retroviral-like aspartic protease family protein [Candidatus Sungbacteria bacterium]